MGRRHRLPAPRVAPAGGDRSGPGCRSHRSGGGERSPADRLGEWRRLGGPVVAPGRGNGPVASGGAGSPGGSGMDGLGGEKATPPTPRARGGGRGGVAGSPLASGAAGQEPGVPAI